MPDDRPGKYQCFLGSVAVRKRAVFWYAACSSGLREVVVPSFCLRGFARLECGCLVSLYHQTAIDRDVQYVEERGTGCHCADHRRNYTLTAAGPGVQTGALTSAQAS